MRREDDQTSRISSSYRDLSVLITGGASFIGSHLAEVLLKAGADVTVIDDLSSGTLANLSAVRRDLDFREGDVRHPDAIAAAVANKSLVFHLASAHGGRGYIDTHPVESMNNLVCDHSVFAASAAAGCDRIVYAGSACAYPVSLQTDASKSTLLTETQCGFDEPGKAFADGEYGWAKLIGELQLAAFHRQFGIDTVACRLFTAYGPRENESHAVIALIAKALARLDPYPIWGDGTQTRNFTYVADIVTGLALAAISFKGHQAVNIGTDQHTSINQLIRLIFDIVGWQPSDIYKELDKPVGVASRAADQAKCRAQLRWSPQWTLREGLVQTIDWYSAHVDRDRLRAIDALLMSR